MYNLGRMWADGLGVEADPNTAKEWYLKALNAFLSAEKELPERKKTYLQYQIGQLRKAISMPSTRLPVCMQKARAWKKI